MIPLMTKFTTSDFDYELPFELIAQTPLPERSSSRLLHLNPNTLQINHRKFNEIVDILNKNDLLVFNDTKVIPARLYGRKASGGKVECLVERVLPPNRLLAQLGASKSPKPGSAIRFADAFDATVIGRQGEFYELQFESDQSVLTLLEKHGEIPLPPYIQRSPEAADQQRYQTVYAQKEGAVAAPTAGLHFDRDVLQAIERKGIEKATVTLHVGAGTFQPVRVDDLDSHDMHRENVEVSAETCQAIEACRERGGRVVAIGTTVVRCLETAAHSGEIKPFTGDTRLFIYPGYRFRCVDALLTNFHLPRSTLLMLVSAFGGYEFIRDAYQEAVKKGYRFFSYGDAMFIG